MANRWWLGLSLALAVAGSHAACGGDETSSSSGGNTSDGGKGGMTTMTTDTSTGGMGGGGGSTPIMCSANYSEVPPGDCDVLQNDCDPGFGCMPEMSGGDWVTNCAASAGLKEAGQQCGGAAECKPGMDCVFNKCTPVCCPDDSNVPCGDGGKCNVTVQYGNYTVYRCSYLPLCDLFDPTTCNNGADGNCYLMLGDGYSACAPGQNVAMDGEMCESLNDCPNNSVCTQGFCRYACALDNWENLAPEEGGCNMGTSCSDVDSGLANIGLCL